MRPGIAELPDPAVLDAVREVERRRIKAIRSNDAEAMFEILDEKFLYINSSGRVYDKRQYINSVRTHELTYSGDIELTETDHRIDDDLVIIVGLMLGHARLEGEAQVYHLRNMRIWRQRAARWRLLAWQSSALWRG